MLIRAPRICADRRDNVDQRMLYQTALDTPVGRLMIEGSREAVTAIKFVSPLLEAQARSNRVVNRARRELREYFSGKRRHFEFPVSLAGLTPFQRLVLGHVAAIDYGQTSTYAELARRVKKISGPRAVGQVNARNPLPIVIPCHRVLGVNGKLTGYAGGIKAKEWLLKHENALLL
jgi:methylated-DNA-[protein]-cysteine S-methyltransferase